MITQRDIERLRDRAARYRREAAQAQTRVQLLYYRGLAAHFEREASELERLTDLNAASSQADG